MRINTIYEKHRGYMSKLKNVGIIINSLEIPQQDYEHLITFFDIYNDPQKIKGMLNDNRFELFGLIPKGFFFKNENTIERIVNTFNEKPQSIAFIIFPPLFKQTCPYFINKRILKIKEPINSLPDMLSLIKEQNLEAKKSTEEMFTYEH